MKYQHFISKRCLLQHQNKINGQKRNKEAVGRAPKLLQYCQIPGQNFPQYFDVHVTFFVVFQNLNPSLYFSISRRTPNKVLGNPCWEKLPYLSSSTVKACMECFIFQLRFSYKYFLLNITTEYDFRISRFATGCLYIHRIS